MEESIKKYREFNFSQSQDWLNYFSNLFPTPSIDIVEKLKRKWYKKNIDQNLPLDLNDNPGFSSTQEENIPKFPNNTTQNSQNVNNNNNSNPSGVTQVSMVVKLEGYMKLAFVPGLFILPGFHLKLLIAAICILAIVRNFGPPKFNKEYLGKVIPSEFFSNLLYLLSISLTTPQNGFVFFLPIAIHMSSGIVEFVSKTNPSWLTANPKVYQISGMIKSNRNALIIAKHKIEFCIFIYLIVLCFFGRSSLFLLIIYLQFLNLKFKFNSNMQTAIWELRNYLVMSPNIPGVLRNIISKFFELFMKAMNLF